MTIPYIETCIREFEERFKTVEFDGIPFNRCTTGHMMRDFLRTTLTNQQRHLREEVEGMKYVFERPKEDYLPEVYKHLKSKNEALDAVLAHTDKGDKRV